MNCMNIRAAFRKRPDPFSLAPGIFFASARILHKRKERGMTRRSIDRPAKGTPGIIDVKSGKTVTNPAIPVLCERIRFFREKADMEQKQLAKQIGITANAVSNWENGRGRPDINLLPDICRALNVSMYDLFDMDDPAVYNRFVYNSEGGNIHIGEMLLAMLKFAFYKLLQEVQLIAGKLG